MNGDSELFFFGFFATTSKEIGYGAHYYKTIVTIILKSYLYTIISIFKLEGAHDDHTGFY